MSTGSVRRPHTPMMCAIGFIAVSAIGGLAGGLVIARIDVIAASATSVLQDSYYIAAHTHYVLLVAAQLAAVFGIFAGWYYLFPKMTGRTYSDFLGKVHFWLLFIGAIAILVPNVIILTGMARRAGDAADGLNLVSSIGSYVWAAGMLVFFANMVLAFLRRRPAD